MEEGIIGLAEDSFVGLHWRRTLLQLQHWGTFIEANFICFKFGFNI